MQKFELQIKKVELVKHQQNEKYHNQEILDSENKFERELFKKD